MEIRSLGHSAFRITTKVVAIVLDPFDSTSVGIQFPKVDADIVLISHGHADHNKSDLVGGNPIVLAAPGEYEIKGVEIKGVGTSHDNQKGNERGKNTVFSLKIEGVTIVHLGDLGHKLEDRQVEELSEVDILMVPVGGTFTLGAKEALGVVTQLEPRVVIPMHYSRPGLSPELASVLEPLAVFLKEMGKETVVAEQKYIISKDKLPDELQLVVLE